MYRYLVVLSEGGLIQGAFEFKKLTEAKREANRIAGNLDREADDVVVLDLHIAYPEEQRVYQPFHE